MFFKDIHPFTKWLAINIVIQPKDDDEIRLVLSYKPRLVGYGVPDTVVKSWTPRFIWGKPDEIEQKMSQQWIITMLSEATQVVQQHAAEKADKPAKAEKPAKATKKTEAVVPKLTPDELVLQTMVMDAEACLKKSQRKEGLEVFTGRIKPLFDKIKETMDAELKVRTITVAKAIMALPEQTEIPV